MGRAGVWLIVGMVGTLAACPVWAQTDARGLEAVLKGKQLVLRSYSAERISRYWWAYGKLVHATPSVHTLGIFVPSSVKERGQKLSMFGSRATLVRDAKSDKLGLAGKSDMEIEIDLNGADAASLLPHLRDLLFFPDIAPAIAGLPEILARSIPATVPRQVSPDPCDCERFLRDGAWAQVPKQDSRLKQPILVYKEDPGFTSEAIAAGVTGSVGLMMLVDATGKATDLWLTVSKGYGLDEAAEAAVQKYRFNPARYDDQPVGVELGVYVNFQIF